MAAKKLGGIKCQSDTQTRNATFKGKGSRAHVGYSSKLFQQIPREESDDGVLGGNDLVRRINVLFLDLALVILVVCREILVDDDGARRAWEILPREQGFDIEVSQFVVPSKGAA